MTIPQHGYRIDTMGGVMARWLPSIEEAKRRYLDSIAEAYLDVDDQAPAIAFEPSTEGESGEPLPPYIRILEDGRWQASISPEPSVWPASTLSRGSSPPLAMVAVNVSGVCTHRVLTCIGVDDPRIECTACGQIWTPA